MPYSSHPKKKKGGKETERMWWGRVGRKLEVWLSVAMQSTGWKYSIYGPVAYQQMEVKFCSLTNLITATHKTAKHTNRTYCFSLLQVLLVLFYFSFLLCHQWPKAVGFIHTCLKPVDNCIYYQMNSHHAQKRQPKYIIRTQTNRRWCTGSDSCLN